MLECVKEARRQLVDNAKGSRLRATVFYFFLRAKYEEMLSEIYYILATRM